MAEWSPSKKTHSRRRMLAGAGALVASVTAGCVGILGGESTDGEIDPAEPPIDRDGTPEEFYYFLEENGIAVEKLAREDDELYLTYHSEAETVDESDEEILVVYEVYKQALIHRGSDIEFLYNEIADPFDGQAHGWGINTDWIRQYDSEEDANDSDNETGNESAIDGDAFSLWNMILNSKVYEEDVDAVGDDEDGSSPADPDEDVDVDDESDENE
ncbi:hypothetical protein [Halovivax gelatinilyticus]|uniref:hypothetical protein n=1 Tax=Halovivax gelatinilyticus TaxID=2961597 RepID=UPI0020CA82B3|nr:hypothetical protein [Halovivax gelatinilyticus]